MFRIAGTIDLCLVLAKEVLGVPLPFPAPGIQFVYVLAFCYVVYEICIGIGWVVEKITTKLKKGRHKRVPRKRQKRREKVSPQITAAKPKPNVKPQPIMESQPEASLQPQMPPPAAKPQQDTSKAE